MEIIKTSEQYIEFIKSLPDDKEIFISTFNIQRWITYGPATHILDSLQEKKSNIIVGIPKFRSCIRQPFGTRAWCKDCYNSHHRTLKNIAKIKKIYDNIKWTIVKNVHSKFVVCDDQCVIGSRNITDGKSEEITIILNNKEISKNLHETWNEYTNTKYDIGENAPLVFTKPYYGELMADSKELTLNYKIAEVAKYKRNFEETRFWIEQLKEVRNERMGHKK